MHNKDKTLVSICIPVFNRENLVLEAIKSAQHQTIRNIEIVVVDNASTDKTYNKVYEESIKDSRIKLFKNNENIGALKNFYRSIELAKSDYVVLLGSDDWLESDFVESRLNGFLLYPDISFVSGPIKIYEQINDLNVILKAKYFYESRIIAYDEIINNFYRKFLISYFCMFKKIDILSNFHFSYNDPYQWGVYKKGLGLDIINCLTIIEKNPSQSIYYANTGCYCFRNHLNRESEEIASQKKGLDKTIVDFTYNTFIFKDYLSKRSTLAKNRFIQYKYLELNYEIFKALFTGQGITYKTFYLLKQYIKIGEINLLIIFKALIFLSYYVLYRVLSYGKRKFS